MTEPSNEAIKIEKALRAALHRLAPEVARGRLQVGATADAPVALLADLLSGATPSPSAHEIERHCETFRSKLTAALAERVAGRARRH